MCIYISALPMGGPDSPLFLLADLCVRARGVLCTLDPLPVSAGRSPCVGALSRTAASRLSPTTCSVIGCVPPDRGCAWGDVVDSDRGEGQYHTAAGPGGGQSRLVPATQPWEQPHHPGHHSCTAHPQLCQAGNQTPRNSSPSLHVRCEIGTGGSTPTLGHQSSD